MLGDVNNFLAKVFDALSRDGVDVSGCELDHVCYRVETSERYGELKQKLASQGELLVESEVGGRLIATYKLRQPILYQTRKIECVELPSPKKGTVYAEGLEHAEFVIGVDFENFMKAYPLVNFDTSALSKSVNPDVRVQYDGFSVKFHRESLEQVIEKEKGC